MRSRKNTMGLDKRKCKTKKAKHYHYQCTKCGSSIDILPSELPYSLDIKMVHNENVSECDLFLYGTCKNYKNNL